VDGGAPLRLFLLGKSGSVTHWLEDAAHAFAALGHAVSVGFVRRPWLPRAVETALAEPIGAALARRVRRLQPELILAIGALHVPRAVLEPIAGLPGRAPLLGWVGDVFEPDARSLADLYDAIAYTDSGLMARHQALGFRAPSLYLPHAADPSGAWPHAGDRRSPRMVFIGNPTPGRRSVVSAIERPVTLYGPGWTRADGIHHEIHARRTPPQALRRIYGGHLAALNMRNERNVLAGLNQRNFDPCLAGAVLVTDDQPDLGLCFEPGHEVAVWRDAADLNGVYDRLLRDPAQAAALAERGRRRVLADHTYGARLEALRTRL
jgi:spore maturation protein CgeB